MSVKERKKQTKHISEGWEKCRGAFGVLKRLYAEDTPMLRRHPTLTHSSDSHPRQGVWVSYAKIPLLRRLMYLLVFMCHQIKNSVCHYTWKLIVCQYAKVYSNSTPKI
jgi:hypothetical protein